MIQVITTYSLNGADTVNKTHHHPSRSETTGKKKCSTFNQPKSLIRGDDDCSRTTATTASIKQVCFAPLVRIRLTIGRDSYTPKEIQASWYSPQEAQQIQHENKRTLQKLERGIPLNEARYCARGLERHMRLASIFRSKNKRQSWHCVMAEQRRQILDTNFDENAIASIYHRTTVSVQMQANVMGKHDARAVEE